MPHRTASRPASPPLTLCSIIFAICARAHACDCVCVCVYPNVQGRRLSGAENCLTSRRSRARRVCVPRMSSHAIAAHSKRARLAGQWRRRCVAAAAAAATATTTPDGRPRLVRTTVCVCVRSGHAVYNTAFCAF